MKRFVYWSLRGVAAATFLLAFASIAVVFIAMSVWLIVSPLVPPSDALVWQDMRCSFGYPLHTDKCVQQRITAAATAAASAAEAAAKKRAAATLAAAEANAKAKQKEAADALAAAEANAKAKQKQAADALAAAKLARDAAEKALSDQNMAFFEGREPGGTTLVVGVVFKGKDAASGIARGFCWATWDSSGYDPRVLIAKINAAGQLEAVQPDDGSRLNWDVTQLAEARKSCPWPKANQS